MGMPGMSTNDMVAYAQSEKSAPVSVIVPTANVSKMTVAELRNRVNPMTKYYDQLPAKAFIEDEAIPDYDKICAIFGEAVAKCISANCIESKLEMLRKAVS